MCRGHGECGDGDDGLRQFRSRRDKLAGLGRLQQFRDATVVSAEDEKETQLLTAMLCGEWSCALVVKGQRRTSAGAVRVTTPPAPRRARD